MNQFEAGLHRLASLYPWEVDHSSELADALSFLETQTRPETFVRAGYGAGMAVVVLAAPLLVLPLPMYATIPLIAGLSLFTIHSVHSLPKLLAAFRRTEALGEMPNLIGRTVLRMQIQPSLESAVRFAAETGFGPLSESLDAHTDRSLGTPRTGLLSFADEWTDDFPAVRRSAHLLSTAQDAPEAERRRTLDRSLKAILDGTRNQMADFTSSIGGPTTALYAFGVMVPLALVALVPAAAIADLPISIWFFVIAYNVVLPIVLVAASLWILVRRPVAFPPPKVSFDHPDIPDRLWLRTLWGIPAAVPAAVFVYVIGEVYLVPVVVVGMGLGAAMLAVFRPIIEVRNHVRTVEEHLTDALYLVGRQVSEGEAVESVIQQAGERVPGETGEVFEHAAGVQKRLHVGVEESFLGEYGALKDVPSARARSTAGLLAIAAREGKPAGRAIVSMADHLEELQDVEDETRRELARVTGTLNSTASYFGPLVAGATVGLAGIMADEGLDAANASQLPTAQLAIVVGTYVITLCLILVPLSVALRHGLDYAKMGHDVGRSLLSAIPLYAITVFAVGLI